MSESEVSEKKFATTSAVSRRLGLTNRQLKRMVAPLGVQPSNQYIGGHFAYDLKELVAALHGMDEAGRASLAEMQKPLASGVNTTSLYAGKFSPLFFFAPPKPEGKTQRKPKAQAERKPSWGVSKADGGGSAEIADIAGFSNPMTVRQVAKYYGIDQRIAASAIYASGLPTVQLKNDLTVDIRKEELGGFIANLPDGVRESVLLSQANRGSKQLSVKTLSYLLHINPLSVRSFLRSLPGAPDVLTEDGLSYVKELPIYGELLAALDEAERAKGGKRRGGRKREFVFLSDMVDVFNISEEEAELLAKRKFFPDYDAQTGTVNPVSRKIPESLVHEMLDNNHYTLTSMSRELGVAPYRLEQQLLKNKVSPVRTSMIGYGGRTYKFLLYTESSVKDFSKSADYQLLLDEVQAQKARSGASKRKEEPPHETDAELEEYLREIEARVAVDARERRFAPKKTVFYVGPTNSGKTYHSLAELFDEYERNEGRGRYVYAGPLRMLAFEVYEKMVERFGEENVGFLTGEEQINPEAPMVACTTEMAPDEGTSLVLDEAHWIVDSSRGQHWTHLLMAGRYTNVHVLTAKEALPTLQALLSDSENLSVREFERRTPIVFAGAIHMKHIPPRTAVVCFSRRTVYALAGELARAGKKVGVLYGALPLRVRKAQIQKYVDGEYDIMVTTDVIGHGINLPIDNVVFAQTEKYDGRERRQIHVWEAAQIAGRAGRYGLSLSGNVYSLTGKGWFSRNIDLMKDGTLAAGGLIPTDLVANEALLFPRYGDLNVLNASELPQAVVGWQQKAFSLMQDRPVVPSDLSAEYKLFERVAEVAGIPTSRPSRDWEGILPETVWQLMSGPFSSKSNVITEATKWLLTKDPSQDNRLERYFDRLVIPVGQVLQSGKGLHQDSVGLFESISSEIGELKMIHVMFGGAGTLRLSELVEYEDIIDSLLIRSLNAAIKSSQYGKCEQCGKSCSPWFSICDSCSFSKSWW